MGKKGGKKKKVKLEGTPDVVKFKQSREYCLLKECVTIQESLPFVAVDALDELAFKKVSRFLNMVGLLGEYLQVETKKDYRFCEHHKYLAPVPQYFPFGYDVDVIRKARAVQEKPSVVFNDEEHQYPEELRTLSENFLKEIDRYMTKIASGIEPMTKPPPNDRLKDSGDLKRFKYELKEDLVTFDEVWVTFELEFVKARHKILKDVFEKVDGLIITENQLTQAEERLEIETKQRLENDFVSKIQEFTQSLGILPPEMASAEGFPEDVIPLAEACIFYESKCTEEWLLLAKYLLKDYLELRVYITKIPEERIKPQLKENTQFMRLLQNFYASVLAAREALLFVSKLPKLIHAKTADWMTKKLLEPDLKYIQKTAHLAME
jgi:hypothetical protein